MPGADSELAGLKKTLYSTCSTLIYVLGIYVVEGPIRTWLGGHALPLIPHIVIVLSDLALATFLARRVIQELILLSQDTHRLATAIRRGPQPPRRPPASRPSAQGPTEQQPQDSRKVIKMSSYGDSSNGE